jgi:hypothetical protein
VSSSCTPTAITPYLEVNGAAWQQAATASVPAAAAVNLGPQPLTGTWSWTGPNGFTSAARQINAIALSAGANVYVATYINTSGCKSTETFTITEAGAGSFTLTPAAATETIAQGASVNDAITVTDVGGFTGTVTLSAASSNPGVTVTVSGDVVTITASPTATGTATITVTGTSGSLTPVTATIAVTAAAPAPTVALSASPKTIASGSSSTLTWSSTNATSCTASGGWTGTEATSGTQSVSPNSTTTYSLTCTGAGGTTSPASATVTVSATSPNVTITVNPAQTHPISPYIYGIDGNSNASTPNVPDVTIFRMGGNRWTAYNWTTNASNAGSDYLYESDNFLTASTVPGFAVYPSINANIAAGQATLFTVPMQGLVSADESGPVPTTNAPDLARFQTIVDKKSSVSSTPFTTTPPVVVVGGEDTGNVYSDEFVWAVNQLSTTKEIFSGTTATPAFVDLDNEPELWNSTHLEIQGPTLITPAAYIAKTLTMTEALKNQFPNMIIFGPSHYGFLGVYNWQGAVTGTTPTGENWFTDEYFQALSTASSTYGRPLVDVYDFHWYPEDYDAGSTRVTSLTAATLSDADMQLIVQAPRNLWDPTFTDPGNSNPWPNSVLGGAPIEFLPRLQAKINAEFPSIKLSISEYETGGFNNIAGTVAQADQLGVYASNGLFAAMLWPPSGTYDYELAGFRAYRNFDGAGSNFGDTLLQSTSSNPGSVMVYVSTDSTKPGRVVLVAINRANTTQVAAITGLSLSGTAQMYQMTAPTAAGQSPVTPVSIGTMAVSGSTLTLTLPAYSVTTINVP